LLIRHIIFEQRGNKYSEPSLMCDKSIWWEEEPGHTPCLDSIQAKGIDLAQFNTQNIVRDIIALRHALGYEQWNLYGTSFSTSLMLLLMEADPAGVRSAILHSVKPPNETTFAHEADSALRAIQHLFASCTADPLCAAAYPDLETQFHELLKSLNASPLEVEVWSWSENAFIPIKFDGDKLIDWIMLDSFYQPAFPPFGTAYLPLFISELNRGNLAPLKAAAQGYWNGMIENSHWSWGLFLAINCQQALPAAGSSRPAADIAASEMLDGFARSTAQRTICVEWDLPALPPAATAYVQSDIPALILAGSYDPVTPPAWSRATADHLANSTYVEFPGYGHNVTINNPCAATLQAEFLRNPQDKLDINCVTEAPGPSFIMRKDLFIAPGIAVSANDIELGGPRGTAWIETTAVISLLALATLLLILLIIGLVWLLRRRKRAARLDKSAVAAYLLALLVIISALTIPILTTRINNEYLGRNTILYSLGPNRDFGPAILMAWIAPLASLLILILALITLWAWLVRRWPLTFRILITLVILASLIFLFLALRWGLFTMLL
jgi:pimeloyl-ACP methyl ester carboxylesterase